MSVTELLEPVLTGGVRNAHFFNGRMLTAEDLRTMQLAVATRQQQLGEAIGEGIVTGFEVSLDPASEWNRPVVTIRKGLAINRRGETLALAGDVELGLVGEPAARAASEGDFAVCDQATVTLTNLGLYLLVVLPASGFEGRVPMTTVGMEGISGSCGSKYALSGVRFRLARVTLPSDSDPESLSSRVTKLATELETQIGQLPPPNQPQPTVAAAEVTRKVSLLRNGAAHLCFGSEERARETDDPVALGIHRSGPRVWPTLISELREAGALTSCEVPLGLVYWTSQGIRFIDQWSVRRPLSGLNQSVEALGLAARLQGQDQLADLAAGSSTLSTSVSIVARDFLFFLPSTLLLNPAGGLDPLAFTSGMVTRGPLFIEGTQLEGLLTRSAAFRPRPVETEEFWWIYHLRENAQAVDAAMIAPSQRCQLLVSGHMPDITVCRFDLARAEYSNISIGGPCAM
jgi:hypothetical protein